MDNLLINLQSATKNIFRLKLIPALRSKSGSLPIFEYRLHIVVTNKETKSFVCLNRTKPQIKKNLKKCPICDFLKKNDTDSILRHCRTYLKTNLSVFDLDERKKVKILSIMPRVFNELLSNELDFFNGVIADMGEYFFSLSGPHYIKITREGMGFDTRYSYEGELSKDALLTKYDLMKIKETYVRPNAIIKYETQKEMIDALNDIKKEEK